MSRIVLIQYWNKCITGNVFYIEELAQYLEQIYNLDVYVYNVSKLYDRNLLLERYKYIVKETYHIQDNDIIYSTMSAFCELIKLQPININKLNKIYIINNLNILNTIRMNLKYFLSMTDKFYLMVDPLYYNGSEKFSLFKDRIIHYQRGIYFKNYIERKQITNTYIVYYSYAHQFEYDLNLYLNKIDTYCQINNIEYMIGQDTDFQSYNIANIYGGLLYCRKKDYMPRIPYEFWYYNKPVVFFEHSEGIETRLQCSLPLEQKIINTTLPELIYDYEKHSNDI